MAERASSRPFARIAVGLFLLAALIAAALRWAEIERFIALAEQARPAWLLVGIGLQALTYVCLALGWRRVLRQAGEDLSLARLVPIALSKLFADQAVPSAGLGGHVLLIERLRRLGVPRPAAVSALLLTLIGYYLSYAVLALIMLATLWIHREVSAWLAGVVTVFLIVATAIPALALWLRKRGGRRLPEPLARIGPLRRVLEIIGEAPRDMLKQSRLLAEVTLFNGAIFLLDAATLASCLLAVGQGFHPAAAFIALIMASIAATLSPIPMGLGSFEATAVAMLSMLGLRVEPALTATLLLRGLTLWLPLLPGLIMLRRTGKIHADEAH